VVLPSKAAGPVVWSRELCFRASATMFQGATAHHHATASASNRFSSFGVLVVMVLLDSKPSGVAPWVGCGSASHR
jgi:hypothetical protein